MILSILPYNTNSFNNALYRTVEPDINLANSLKVNLTTVQLTPITIGRISKGVVPRGRSVAGESSFLTTFDTTKERFVGFIQPSKHILAGREISYIDKPFITKLFEFFRLIIVRNAFLCDIVNPNTLFKGHIVQFTSFKQLVIDGLNLALVRVKAIFVCKFQSGFNLNTNTLLRYNILINQANGGAIPLLLKTNNSLA
ncbi:hypothetical protein LCGC14_2631630 [marine sediment metagenome]|uniref:Uncharacterized protein n=1 Tax=marine sediment metagenome TaxID=412755 RepID=A0A0F9AMM6_9ZZZZ